MSHSRKLRVGRTFRLERGIDDFAQFAQVIRTGIDLQQHAARLEYPGKLAINREAEHAQHKIKRRRLRWQIGVAADNPVGALVLLGGRQHRPFRDIQPEQGQHLIVAGCRSQLAQVVTLAATGIKAADRRTGGSVGQRNPADCRGDRLVMAGVEETPAGRDHFLAVTGVARTLSLDGQQVGVALGGDVETVAGGATPA